MEQQISAYFYAIHVGSLNKNDMSGIQHDRFK